MKKYVILVIITTLFGFMSCANNDEDITAKPETVTFNIQAEQGMTTRATAPVVAGKDARYIVEVWNAGNTTRLQRIVQVNNTAFSVALDRALTYNIAVWVDYVNTGVTTDLYYVTTDFKRIVLNTLDEDPGAFDDRTYLMSNLPARDAFTGVFTFTAGQPYPTSLQVKRPLAKINVIATDAGLWKNSTSIAGDTIKLAIANPGYFVYNVLTQKTNETALRISFVNKIPSSVYANYPDGVNQTVISGLYFANTASADNDANTPNFEIHSKLGMNPQRPVITVTGLPFKRNFITNITGGVLLNTANFNIDVDSEYGEPDIDTDF